MTKLDPTAAVRPTQRLHYDRYARVVRLIRLERKHRGCRWRWDVQFWFKRDGAHSSPDQPGGLVHNGGDAGYTRTYLGALLALGRSARRNPARIALGGLVGGKAPAPQGERAQALERAAWIAEHPNWHPLGRLNDIEHTTAVRIAAAIRAEADACEHCGGTDSHHTVECYTGEEAS